MPRAPPQLMVLYQTNQFKSLFYLKTYINSNWHFSKKKKRTQLVPWRTKELITWNHALARNVCIFITTASEQLLQFRKRMAALYWLCLSFLIVAQPSLLLYFKYGYFCHLGLGTGQTKVLTIFYTKSTRELIQNFSFYRSWSRISLREGVFNLFFPLNICEYFLNVLFSHLLCVYIHVSVCVCVYTVFWKAYTLFSWEKKVKERSTLKCQRKIALHVAFYFIHIFIPVLLCIVNIGACVLCSLWAEVELAEAPRSRPLLQSDS